MFTLSKYNNQWAIFDAKSRCFVLFGPKKAIEKRLIELNKGE